MNVNPFSYLMNKISTKVSKSGDTMTGALNIVTSSGNARLELGNATNSRGIIRMYSNNDKHVVVWVQAGLTEDRNVFFPDNGGTLALTSDVDAKVSKSGDTMSGRLLINRPSSSTAVSWSELEMGNDTAEGTVGNSAGRLVLLGKGTKYTILDAPNSTANRTIDLPDKSGTVALTSDFTPASGTTSDGYIYWARSGNVATVRIINGNFSNTGAGTSFYILPSNLLPLIGADQRDSYSNKRIKIEPDGSMICMDSISSTILRGSFTYICQ